jgi:hypothetical protein
MTATANTPMRRLIRQTGLSDAELADYLAFKLMVKFNVETLQRHAGNRYTAPDQKVYRAIKELLITQAHLRNDAWAFLTTKDCKSVMDFKLWLLETYEDLEFSDAELAPAAAVIDLELDDGTRNSSYAPTSKIPQQIVVVYTPIGADTQTCLTYQNEQSAWVGAKAHICEAESQQPIVMRRERWLKAENGWKVVQITHPIKVGDLEPRWLPYGVVAPPDLRRDREATLASMFDML